MGNPYSNLAKNIQKVTSATSDYKDIVDSVIRGDYGNGQPRFDKLTAEGHDWARVQNLVNERLGCSFRYTEELTTSQEDLNKEQAKTNLFPQTILVIHSKYSLIILFLSIHSSPIV